MQRLAEAVSLAWMLLVGSVAGRAWATPNTLVAFPSTDLYAKGATHFDLDTYSTKDGHVFDLPTYYGLEFGFGKVEAGFDALVGEGAGRLPILLNGKVLLAENKRKGLRLVAGVFNVGDSDQPLALNVSYLTGSKTTPYGRFHVGVLHGSESKLGRDETSAHFAYDRSLSKRWSFAIDGCTGKSAIGTINPGLYYYLTPNSDILLGWNRYNDRSLSDTLYATYDVSW